MKTFKVYGTGAGPGTEIGNGGLVTGEYDINKGALAVWVGTEQVGEPHHILPLHHIQRIERPVYGEEVETDPTSLFTVYVDNVPSPNNPYGFGSLLVNGDYQYGKGVLKIWYGRAGGGQPDLIYPLHHVFRTDLGDTRPADGPWA